MMLCPHSAGVGCSILHLQYVHVVLFQTGFYKLFTMSQVDCVITEVIDAAICIEPSGMQTTY